MRDFSDDTNTPHDALAASAPLDKAAALARDGGGETWEPHVDPRQVHSDLPPPMRAVPRDTEDLTGRRAGKLTVVGLAAQSAKHGRGGARWAVRCVCGRYELRSRRALLGEGHGSAHQCRRCDVAEQMRAGTFGGKRAGAPPTDDQEGAAR